MICASPWGLPMATPEQVNQLLNRLSGLRQVLENSLVAREAWGGLTFDVAAADLKMASELVAYLSTASLEYLPQGAVNVLDAPLVNLLTPLNGMNGFSPGEGASRRDALAQQLHNHTDALLSAASSWLPIVTFPGAGAKYDLLL